MKSLKSLALITAFSASVLASATELVLIPIKNIQQNRSGSTIQILVKMDFDSCKYNYRGLYPETVASSGQGQVRYQIRAMGLPIANNTCNEPKEERTDSLELENAGPFSYDFIPVQPH